MINEYDIKIDGEPEEVTEIRHKILDTFKDLRFVEETHQYFLNDKELPSVSHVTHGFNQDVDFDLIAENYALKHGETKEYWQDVWKRKNLMSTILGTRVHAYGESLGWVKSGHPELIVEEIKPQYFKEKNWLIPIHKKEEAIEKFLNDLPPSYHLVLNEARVYSGLNSDESKNPNTQYAGCFDMLYYYDGNGDKGKSGLVIFDYKNNGSLTNEFNRKRGIFMKEPFINLYDEALSNYTLQLSAYSIPLQDLGYKILDRKLIWVKDDGTYEKIFVPDMSNTLREIL